jgi:hypothetical protein
MSLDNYCWHTFRFVRVYLVILGCLVVKEYKEIWERKAKRARKEGKDFQ